MNKNYLAIILAAGKGSRLEYKGPKALFEINNIPLIQYLYNSITSLGSIDLLTVVGYKKNTLIKYIKNKSITLDIKIKYSKKSAHHLRSPLYF